MSLSTSARHGAAGVRPSEWRVALLLMAAVLAITALSPGVQRVAESSLVVHMLLQHWLLVGAGVIGASGALGLRPLAAGGLDRLPGRQAGALLFLVVVAAAHVPAVFGGIDAHPALHVGSHLAYVVSGAALRLALPAMGAFLRLLLLLGAGSLMTLLAMAMMTGAVQFPGYGASETVAAGIGMIVAMQLVIPILIVTPRVSALLEHRRLMAPALVAAALLLAAAAGASVWLARPM